MENWLNFSGGNKDIVLSSRIRLARNIKDISFPHKLKEDEGRDVVNKVEEAFILPFTQKKTIKLFIYGKWTILIIELI